METIPTNVQRIRRLIVSYRVRLMIRSYTSWNNCNVISEAQFQRILIGVPHRNTSPEFA